MSVASRILHTAALLVLFGLGAALHLASRPLPGWAWLPWGGLALALLAVALAAVWLSGRPGAAALRRALSWDPAHGLAPMAFIVLVLSLSVLYIYLEGSGPGGLGRRVTGFLSFGLWAPLGAMAFYGFQLSRPRLSWVEGGLSLFAMGLSIFVLAMGAFYYQARIVLIAAISLLAMIKGNRLLKVLSVSALAAYFALGAFVIVFRREPLYPLYFWVFAGMPEIDAAFDLILRRTAFAQSGLWGVGGGYIQEVGLPLPDDMGFNCLPYLALLGGHASVGLYAASLFLLMGALLLNILRIRGGWAGTVAISAWFVLAIDQYLSFLALLTPTALILGGGTVGLPFIGSFESGAVLLAFVLFVLAAHKVARENSLAPGAPEGGAGAPGDTAGGLAEAGGAGAGDGDGLGDGRAGGAGDAGGEPKAAPGA